MRTDGSPAMSEKLTRLVPCIKAISHSDLIISHCLLHLEQLVTKDMCADLYVGVLIVDYILEKVRVFL